LPASGFSFLQEGMGYGLLNVQVPLRFLGLRDPAIWL
jgi:hypothetical protein